jgi:HlyD family secretion protein
MMLSVTATGSIVPRAEASLSFDLPGKVVAVEVEVGENVDADQVLARVDGRALDLNVRQAEAALAAAQAQLDQLEAGPREDEVAAAQANVAAAEAGLTGSEANLRALEGGADRFQIAAAEANLRAAEANLWLATIQRDQIKVGATQAEIAAAEAQVASALVQEKVARDTHDRTLTCQTVTLPDGSEQEICPALGTIEEQARFNLFAAEQSLTAAQAQLEQLQQGPTQEQVDTGTANVVAATAQRDASENQLEQLRAGSSAEQLEAARANVETLQAQRDAAQAQLDLLLAGASPYQIAAAQASVNQAQVGLEVARTELEKAALVAPFPGVVTAVNAQQGQTAPAGLPAVVIADTSELQIVVDIDEIDVARVADGQPAVVRLDAIPDVQLTGHVSRVAPAASQLAGVVVYQVTIVLDEADVPLRIGMTATGTIVLERIQDVLLVPNWAVRIDQATGKTYVNLLKTSTVAETEVTLGLRGEDESQVVAGLNEGDVVVAGDVIGLKRLLETGD